MKKILFYLIMAATVSIGLSSCDSFLEIDAPIDQITVPNVYKNKEMIKAAALGIYVRNSTGNSSYYSTMPLYLSAIVDDAIHKSGSYNEIMTNTYDSYSSYIKYFWGDFYESIYIGNLFIEQLEKSDPNLLTDRERNKYYAEAKFFRAYSHLALTMIYGTVPFITATDAKVTNSQKPISREMILENVVKDLLEAEQGLDGHEIENVYVNVDAVRALLARVYIYQEKWADAISMSTKVLETSKAILEPDLSDVHLRTGKEAIFKFTTVEVPGNYFVNFTRMGYLGQGTRGQNNLFLRKELLDAFEEGDARRTKWVGESNIPEGIFQFLSTKYKQARTHKDASKAEDFIMLRVAEQYLIRAEAKIETNDLSGAEDDLNIIRNRAELPDLEGLNQDALMQALRQERRVEMFYEEYHRLVDLSRWDIIDEVLGAMANKKWKSHARLLPIPSDQIYANPNLIQNEGY